MSKRVSLPRNTDKKVFSTTAEKTNLINSRKFIPRGGIKLC